MGVRVEIEVEGTVGGEKNGILAERIVRLEGERWRMIGVYERGDLGEKLNILRE